jgi:hypothetical protein
MAEDSKVHPVFKTPAIARMVQAVAVGVTLRPQPERMEAHQVATETTGGLRQSVVLAHSPVQEVEVREQSVQARHVQRVLGVTALLTLLLVLLSLVQVVEVVVAHHSEAGLTVQQEALGVEAQEETRRLDKAPVLLEQPTQVVVVVVLVCSVVHPQQVVQAAPV